MNRREFLNTAAVTRAFGAASPGPLEKGQRFNESVEFRDAVTARPSRRLTANRRWNQTPTYHQNACFARDSRHLVLTTEDEAGNSALLLADAETGDMRVIATSADIKDSPRRPNFNGNNVCVNQAGDWAAASVGGSVRVWDLTTLKERVIYPDAGEKVSLGHPIGSIDGKLVFFTLQHRAPEASPTDFMEADLSTGKVRVMHHEDRAACNHVVPNPVHPDIILIDRDWPPLYGGGGDNFQTTRVWLLNRRTDKLTEVRPRDRYRFCWHSNFNGRGDRVYYHGPSSTGGMFFGVGDLEGNVVWEHLVPAMIYGHMCTHPSWDAMITDGFFSDDLVTAIFYKDLDRTGAPRLQVLARHDTDWSTNYGQYAHPHCHVSPDGKWMTYNRAGARFAESRIAGGAVAGKGTAAKAAAHLAPLAPGDGRSDVYVVRIG